jgi:exodeoxyribonuclease VII large subunit
MDHISLYELNILIRNALLITLEQSYWVVAEIAEMRVHHNSHCFLELVEKEGQQIRAKTRATIWASGYLAISTRFAAFTGQHLKPGMKILFNASIQYHELYGLSLLIRDIDAQYTIGERARKRQEIIDKLIADGVFDMNREIPMPLVPRRIAVISSESAAGYGDFMNQLNQNEYGYRLDVTLFPALMQGEKAEKSIVDSLLRINSKISEFDLVVVIRGGGATLDLECFDGYELGSHIAQFPIPVVTGIGHERDETIADMVANKKLKTPTAVAVFLIETISDFEARIDEHFSSIADIMNDAINETSQMVDQYSNRLFRKGQFLLNTNQLHLARHINLMNSGWKNRLKLHDTMLDKTKQILRHQALKTLDLQAKMMSQLERHLFSISPESILRRGFSITTINGKNVNTFTEIPAGAEMTTITEQHDLTSKVTNSKRRKQ